MSAPYQWPAAGAPSPAAPIPHSELLPRDLRHRTSSRRKHSAHMIEPGHYLVSSRRLRHWFPVQLVAGQPICLICCCSDCCHANAVGRRLERAQLEVSALQGTPLPRPDEERVPGSLVEQSANTCKYHP